MTKKPNIFDIVFNLTFGTLLLAVALLLWVVYELHDQRDFWRKHYCFEVLKTNPNHSACEYKE
jgi:hypothetical protein